MDALGGRAGRREQEDVVGERPVGGEDELRQELDQLRGRISEVDDRLIRTIGERREIALAIGRLKEKLGLPVLDPAREAEVVRKAAVRARELGVDEEMTRDVIWRIISSARTAQEGGRS